MKKNKICSKCNFDKPLDEFHKNSKSLDGYKCWCKTCVKEYDKNIHPIRYTNNKKDINSKSKKHYDSNPNYYTKYREINKINIKKTINNSKKKRYHSDPVYRLKETIRRSINYHLKNNNLNKSNKTLEILGCSYEQFNQYIESQWELWMNWGNYGNPKDGLLELDKTWDLDHIIPISTAKTYDDIIRLSHYTNLRPLCSYYNRLIKKNNNPKFHL